MAATRKPSRTAAPKPVAANPPEQPESFAPYIQLPERGYPHRLVTEFGSTPVNKGVANLLMTFGFNALSEPHRTRDGQLVYSTNAANIKWSEFEVRHKTLVVKGRAPVDMSLRATNLLMQCRSKLAPKDLRVVEGISSTWHYHLRDHGQPSPLSQPATCGARVMTTEIPLATWGTVGHLRERWCQKCAEAHGIAARS